MHRVFVSICLVTMLVPTVALAYPTPTRYGVTRNQSNQTYVGYTLIAPSGGPTNGDTQNVIRLLDMRGQEVHRWTTPKEILTTAVELLPDGTLFHVGRERGLDPDAPGSVVQELAWDSSVTWEFRHPTWHHGVVRLPNGNIVGYAYELMKPANAERLRGGIAGSGFPEGMYADVVMEIDRTTKEPVWTWRAEDELKIEEYALEPLEHRKEFTHANMLAYLPADNTLTGVEGFLFSFRNISTVLAIEKATKKVVWQLKSGLTSKQHDPTLLPNGRILLFDNGMHRPGTDRLGVPYTRVIEVDPKTQNIEWSYGGDLFQGIDFLSPLWGGAQRLPNGNTLITEGMTGRVFEVTNEAASAVRPPTTGFDRRVVWEYVSPFVSDMPLRVTVTKAWRYGPDDIDWPEKLPPAAGSLTSNWTDLDQRVWWVVGLGAALVVSTLVNIAILRRQHRATRYR